MVNRSIPRDVGTIVGQCLDRDPSRRYSDGNALATDIRRFLDERPIRARAPSVVYRAAKFARRNRALVGGVLATVLTLLIGVVVAGGFASGQYRARLAAEASDREARRQQTRLASFTFQSAADHSMSGNTLASIEQLELIPAGVRGWGWDLLAASVPLWMPGTAGFGGVAFNRHAGTAWTGNRTFVLVNDGKQVLTIIDGSLVTWDPWSGETSAHPELGRFVRVEDVPHTPLPVALVFGEDERPGVLDTKEWRILPAEEGTERLPVPWRVEPSSGALLWQEDEADGAGSRGAGGTASYLATRSHGHRRLELGSDAGTQLPGWVDVRNLDDRVVLSLYDERAEGLWCRLACVDAATGRVLARTERATESMAVVLLPERDEIATAAITYPERAPAGELLVYDAERLELRRRFDRIAQPLAYLPDRDRLVVRLENGEYRLMDLDDGRLDGGVLCRDLDRDNMGPLIHSNGVMHGGASVVAITDRPYRPLVIDTTEPQVGLRPSYHARPLPGALYHLAVSPHGGLLATMSPWHDEIAVLDARTGETLATRQMRSAGGHRWHAMLWFSPRGDALHATVEAADGSVVGVTSWSLAEGTSRSAIPERPSPMNSTVPRLVQESLPPGGSISARHAVTPGGDALLFTGSGENTIKRLDLAGHTFERLPIGTAEGIALSPDGRHLAAVASLGARIIDIETGEVVARPISDPDRLLSVAYSPDGSTLAVGSQDGRIFVVETEFYTLLYSFQSTPPEDGRGPLFVHDLRWSPDSRTLYAAHAGGVLTAWEARHPQERRARSQRQEDADRVASENLDAMLSRGLSVADAGQRLLSDRPLTPAQRAAGEVALVRRWAAGSDPE